MKKCNKNEVVDLDFLLPVIRYIVYFCQLSNDGSIHLARSVAGQRLQILPSGPQDKQAGKNLVLTCRAKVPNAELIRDLKWIDPVGEEISQDSR